MGLVTFPVVLNHLPYDIRLSLHKNLTSEVLLNYEKLSQYDIEITYIGLFTHQNIVLYNNGLKSVRSYYE